MISVPSELNAASGTRVELQGPESAQQLASSTYRELRESGFSDTDIMAFAGKLLSLVASEVRGHGSAE